VRHAEAAGGGRVGEHCGQNGLGFGALNSDDGAIVGRLDAPEGSDHIVGIGRIWHDIEHVGLTLGPGMPPHNDVVKHGCVVRVEQVCVLGSPRCDLSEIVGQCGLEPVEGSVACDAD